MTAPLITLNATVAEIEDALLAGKSVKDVARDLAEPPNNVYGVYRDLVRRGEINDQNVTVTKRPDLTVARQQTTGVGSASRPVPAPPALAPPVNGSAEPTIDALVNAAARSTSKRTQALGVKLAALATVVRDRLRDERAAAEAKAREAEVRDAAAAEVAALEAKLAEARAKLKGSGSTSRRGSKTKTTDNPAGQKSPRPAYEGGPPSSVIRAWAKANNYEISDRGQLPPGVIEDYRREHGGGAS